MSMNDYLLNTYAKLIKANFAYVNDNIKNCGKIAEFYDNYKINIDYNSFGISEMIPATHIVAICKHMCGVLNLEFDYECIKLNKKVIYGINLKKVYKEIKCRNTTELIYLLDKCCVKYQNAYDRMILMSNMGHIRIYTNHGTDEALKVIASTYYQITMLGLLKQSWWGILSNDVAGYIVDILVQLAETSSKMTR